jgi:hypothetical protein
LNEARTEEKTLRYELKTYIEMIREATKQAAQARKEIAL